MKCKLAPLLIAIASSFLLVGCATTQWEYKVFTGYLYESSALEKKLNQYSSEGWTVVSSSTSQVENTAPQIVVILKKHK